MQPSDFRSYAAYHKASGLSNEEASARWMEYKLSQKPTLRSYGHALYSYQRPKIDPQGLQMTEVGKDTI